MGGSLAPRHYGGKAAGLIWLASLEERVPEFFLVSEGELPDADLAWSGQPAEAGNPRAGSRGSAAPVVVSRSEALATFDRHFSSAARVAVRSSAHDEDGFDTASAGRYLTRLDVARDELPEALAAVFESLRSAGSSGFAVVQRMVPALVSGVVFTENPLGLRNELVITLAAGAGTAVTEAASSSTSFVNLTDGQWWTETGNAEASPAGTEAASAGTEARKASTEAASAGTEAASAGTEAASAGTEARKASTDAPRNADRRAPVPSADLKDYLVDLGCRLATAAGLPLDIEVAITNDLGQDTFGSDTVWLVQARPITGLSEAASVTLDSSNIVESYPGLTLPLTASFVPRAYAGVFRGLVTRVSGDARAVDALDGVLTRMVTASSGRLYYRIDHWYQLLLTLPFARSFLRVWQDSLGVTDRSHPAPTVRLGFGQRLAMPFRLLGALATVPLELELLRVDVAAAREGFEERLGRCETVAELAEMAEQLESTLLARWDITLLNDLRAFAFPALVEKWLTLRRLPDAASTARALIAGDGSLVSLGPLRLLAELAEAAPPGLLTADRAEFSDFVSGTEPFAARLRAYLDEYGDRGLAELKLESTTLRTDPGALQGLLSGARRVEPTTPVRPSADPILRALASCARAAIAGREAARLDRARVFGMVRAIVRRAGALAVAAGRLDAIDDIFWLTWDEAFGVEDVRTAIADRRADYAAFAPLPHYRRLVFAGEPFDRRAVSAASPDEGRSADERRLVGVPVSPGVARGRVRVVQDPTRAAAEPGDVLVTTMTDPGWVFLLSRAAAVVAERGSALSHTAIVARELRIPMVVGIVDVPLRLRPGALVEVDGTTGVVSVQEDR